jgi:hypothetical protein
MIEAIRFRLEGTLVVLQVQEREMRPYYDREPTWRDAKVEDLLEAAQFMRPNQDLEHLSNRMTQIERDVRDQFRRATGEA